MIQKIILGVSGVLVAWLLTSCGTTSPVTTPSGLGVPETNKPPVVTQPSTGPRVGELLVEAYACRWGGIVNGAEEVFATLVLRNKSNKNVSNARVKVTFKSTNGQEVGKTYDFARNLVPDEMNVKGPNIVEARLAWPTGASLKSCQATLEKADYTN
jgi:hypothetical protein